MTAYKSLGPGTTPHIHIKCEVRSNGLIGTTMLNVVRVEPEDDGTYTAVTDYWPLTTQTPPAAPEPPTTPEQTPFMYAYTDVDRPGESWRVFRKQLERSDGSICPGIALYREPPESEEFAAAVQALADISNIPTSRLHEARELAEKTLSAIAPNWSPSKR